jgi:hypothetical protein
METMIYTSTLVIETCCNCNMKFGMDRQFYNECRDAGPNKVFYCPNGHRQWYSKGRIAELEQSIASLKNRESYLQQANASLHNKLTEKNHSIRALKGVKTRIMNRVKNGVCPCCNRSFSDLQKHFKSKHPELLKTTEV